MNYKLKPGVNKKHAKCDFSIVNMDDENSYFIVGTGSYSDDMVHWGSYMGLLPAYKLPVWKNILGKKTYESYTSNAMGGTNFGTW